MKTLILQDWYEENDLLNPSLFALIELLHEADVGFLQNFENKLPHELADRRVAFYGARLTRKNFDNLEELIALEEKIPWCDYDLVVCNTRGYLRHFRKGIDAKTRIIVYQHDLLAALWRINPKTLNEEETATLLLQQELDLEYAHGINLTIAANFALQKTLSAMFKKNVSLAYPLIDQTIFFPENNVMREYFVALDTVDRERLTRLFACMADKLIVFGEYKHDKLLRELKPDNIYYTGPLTLADQAYYLAGAKAFFCGETHSLSHLPLASLKMGIPLIAHPTQGMTEILEDSDTGVELESASEDELIRHIRHYRNAKESRTKISASVDWLNKESFVKRLKKSIERGI
ncbi:MAG TPA: hypothetical protein PLY93_04345 [Turneriella sp.]|nr:hypothetical protein [Turneriella sp.]